MKIRNQVALPLLVLFLVVGMAGKPASGILATTLTSASTTVAPTIDGSMAVGEWAPAIFYSLSYVGDKAITVTVWIMHDTTNLYIAFEIPDGTNTGFDAAEVYFDFDNDGLYENPDGDATTIDDAFVFQTNLVTGARSFWTWGSNPDEQPGAEGLTGASWSGISNPGVVDAYSWTGTHYIWETSTPLSVICHPEPGIGFSDNDASVVQTTLWFTSWWPTWFPKDNNPDAWDAADAAGMGDLKFEEPEPCVPEFPVEVPVITSLLAALYLFTKRRTRRGLF